MHAPVSMTTHRCPLTTLLIVANEFPESHNKSQYQDYWKESLVSNMFSTYNQKESVPADAMCSRVAEGSETAMQHTACISTFMERLYMGHLNMSTAR